MSSEHWRGARGIIIIDAIHILHIVDVYSNIPSFVSGKSLFHVVLLSRPKLRRSHFVYHQIRYIRDIVI